MASKTSWGEVAKKLKAKIEVLGGEASYEHLAEWANQEGVDTFALKLLLNDLVRSGVAIAPQGYYLPKDDEMGFMAPKTIKLILKEKPKTATPQPTPRAVEKHVEEPRTPLSEEEGRGLSVAITYLNEYPSVGRLRLINDLKTLGLEEPEKTLRRLLEMGYATISPLGVVNAAERLPKVKSKPKKLAAFI